VTCVALCFLAFLRHFFFCLPDFFLHAFSALCASASPAPSVKRLPRAEPASSRKAVRREGGAESKRESASKRFASTGRFLDRE
jgi:hypothetical protein